MVRESDAPDVMNDVDVAADVATASVLAASGCAVADRRRLAGGRRRRWWRRRCGSRCRGPLSRPAQGPPPGRCGQRVLAGCPALCPDVEDGQSAVCGEEAADVDV